jgi:hypothetical protein
MKTPYLLFASFALLFFISCEKYEDGPAFSLLSKKSRVVGEWYYEGIYVDGVEMTTSEDLVGFSSTFEKNGEYLDLAVEAGNPIVTFGTWEFANDKEELAITTQYVDWNNTLVYNTINYKILRLTNKELWYSRTVNGSEYEIHLKSKYS